MIDEVDDEYPDDWIHYNSYTAESEGRGMLEHIEIGGPGPPVGFPGPPEFFLPPPPLPGDSLECSTFSSHFDSCDISKESTSGQDPHLHLMSVIVAVLCLVILFSCITIFLVWRRRRSKAHQAALHSYCVSSSSSGLASQFYDDLYISNHTRIPVSQNQYCSTNTTQYHPTIDLSSFLLRTSPTGQPIYEEIPNSLGPLLPSSSSCSEYVDTTSGYHSLESETGPFLLPLTRVPILKDSKSNKRFFTFHRPYMAQDGWEGGGRGEGRAETEVSTVSPRVRYRPNLVHSRTMDLGGSGGSSGRDGRRGRRSQEDFLPRQAWTEEEEWEGRRLSPPDLVRGGDGGGNTTSTSDVTVSPSSSESYPECRF